MVSVATNQLILTNEESKHGSGQSYFDKKWTYEEFLEELKKPIVHPDPHDVNDPGYYKKWAHTVPPMQAYYFIPDRKDSVAVDVKT